VTARGHAQARHFAPAIGIDEDPVTGSASGGMAGVSSGTAIYRKNWRRHRGTGNQAQESVCFTWCNR
jgi:predicted PhzF superfamily epimerase YddE/YHI9